MEIKSETFRGRKRLKVIEGGKLIGFVRRAPDTKTRWQWLKGFGPVSSSHNYPSRVKAAKALVSHVASNPEPEPPKKLETIGPSRFFDKPRANNRNRRARRRR